MGDVRLQYQRALWVPSSSLQVSVPSCPSLDGRSHVSTAQQCGTQMLASLRYGQVGYLHYGWP